MRKPVITLLFLSTFLFVAAQTVETFRRSTINLEAYPNEKPSVFIHPETPLHLFKPVASYKATGKDSLSLQGDLFLLIKIKARKDGANCFSLQGLEHDSLNRPLLYVDAFHASDSLLAENKARFGTNRVFIFGSGKKERDTFSLKVNDQVRTFASGTYLEFVLKEGEEIRLGKGGFAGARARITYEENKPPLYFMVFGGLRTGHASIPVSGTMGVRFNSGMIREMTDDYGQFMVLVSAKAE